MADFSKQYCDLHDPEMPADFDILEVAEKLKTGHYLSYICEGFGFVAIGKDETGSIKLAVPDYSTDLIEWKDYEQVIK